MKPYFDLAFKRPNGKANIVIFSCKENDHFNFLVELCDNIARLRTHEEENDVGKSPGKYEISLAGIKQILPGADPIFFYQDVCQGINYDGMFYSLSSGMIFDIVNRIHLEEKGEFCGSEKNRRDIEFGEEAEESSSNSSRDTTTTT